MVFVPQSGDPRSQYLGYLRSIGYPEHLLGGIDMNAVDESGWNPTAVGDNGNAFGILQWNGPRKRALEAFAREQGRDPGDPVLQAMFTHHENQTSERAAYEAALNAPDAGTAGAIWVNQWERPAETHRASRSAKYSGGKYDMGSLIGGGPATASSRGGGNDPLSQMLGGDEDWIIPERTTGERVRGGLSAASEALTALGGGHGTNFAATDEFLQGQRERAIMKATMDARRGVQPANVSLDALAKQGHQDLVDMVNAGGMSVEEAFKVAAQRGPAKPPDPADLAPEAAAEQLNGMGRPDLAKAVLAGAMETQKALEIAMADAPVPGQELSKDQLAFAQAQQRELTQGLQSVEALNGAVSNIEQMGAAGDRFSDQMILQQFSKVLDPLSVVREGEVSFVADAASGMQGMINNWLGMLDPNTGRLPEGVRETVIQAARNMRENALRTANSRYTFRRGQVEAQGINPDKWLPNPEEMFTLPEVEIEFPAGGF